MLSDGVTGLYARGRWTLAAELRAAFEGGAGDDPIQTDHEFLRAEESLENGEPQRAVDYLRALLPRFRGRHPLEKWRLAEACARAGLYADAEELARATPVPPLDAVSTMQLGVSRSAVTPLQYHRLRYACGETLAPARLVPSDPSPRSAGLVLFYRATCVAARLWGKMWRGEPVTVEDFRREASELLASLKRRFNDRIHWQGLYSDLSQDELAVYSALIEAGKLHGPAVIEALTEVFASEWSQPTRRVYWITRVKRDVCLELARAGASHDWVVQWLECCEQEIARPENANSHASEYSAQARAWLQVGEVARATTMMSASARSSPGMIHSHDDQLKWWVSLLGEHWAKEPANGLRRVAWFVHCLKILDFSTDHHELRDASARVVWAAYLVHPAAGPKTLRLLLEAEVVRYDEGLAWMLRGALSDTDAPASLSFRLTCNLLLPVAVTSDSPLAEALFVRLGQDFDGVQAAEFATEFAHEVCTEALPATRRAWLRGAARGARLAGCPAAARIFASALDQLLPDSERSYRTSDEPADAAYDRLAATINNFATLRAASMQQGLPANFPWHEILGEVTRNLSPVELVAATELFSAHSCYAKVCEKAGEELLARGRRAEAIAVAEKALDRLDAGSDPYGDTRNAVLVCGPLLRAAPERALARLSALFAKYGGPELDQIEALLRHAANGPEKLAATEEIDAFVQAYLSGCGEPDDTETAAVGDVPAGRSAADELVGWLFEHLTHPIPMVRQSAQKAVGQLLMTGDAATTRMVSDWLADQPPTIDALLFVLKAVAYFDPQVLVPYRPALESLARHQSFDVRSEITSICTLAGWPVPVCFESKPLSSVYRMILTPPPAPARSGSPDARLAALSTDPAEGSRLTESYTPQLRALSAITGIPYGNLVHRVLQLAREAAQGENLFDPAREELFARRLSRGGLPFSYHRPHTLPARRALSRMLAELVDGGIIPVSAMPDVGITFAREDAQTLLWQPAVRPSWIPFVAGTDSHAVSRRDWIQEADLAAVREPWTTPSGRYILASISRFRLLGEERRETEQRGSAILPQSLAPIEPDEVEDGLFEVTRLPRVEDYWHGLYDDEVAGLAVLQAAFIISPNEPWLALHPMG